MWVSRIRSVSRRTLFQNNQFSRFYAVSELPCFSSYCSDSSSDEEVSTTQNPIFTVKNDINFRTRSVDKLNSYEVIEILSNLKKEPTVALSFFEQAAENGFKHNVETYVAIIRILCFWGMDRKLDSVLMEVINSKEEDLGFGISHLIEGLNIEGPNLFSRALDALIKAYGNLGMFDEAIDTLFSTNRGDYVPSLLSCNYLMNKLVVSGKVETAVSLYKQLKMLGLDPNVYTYAIIIKAYCKKGSFLEAESVFHEMKKIGVTPNVSAYTNFIKGLCLNGMSNIAYITLQEWKRDNKPLDLYAYTCLIRGFVKEKQLNEAEKVWFDMEEHGFVPDAFCYSAIIRGYCENGNVLKALAFLENMTLRDIKINCVILSPVLQCLSRMGLASETVDQFMHFKELGMFQDEISYNIAIDALCKLGKLEEAVKLVNEMKDKRLVCNVIHYTTLMNGYCLHGRLSEAVKLLMEMKNQGIEPNMITYNVLVGGFSRNGSSENVFEVLNIMKRDGLIPTSVTHNIIIKGLCTGGKVEKAETFFESIQEKTPKHYGAMINGYCGLNDSRRAYEIFLECKKQRIFMKRKPCLKLLSILCVEGEYVKALNIFEVFLGYEDGPCKKMYWKLIAALCNVGRIEEARRALDNMVARGLSPGVKLYTIMINGYCKLRFLNEAFSLFETMKDRGVIPDIITYTVLFDGHSKVERAKSVVSGFWNEIKEMELAPDVIWYTALIDSHCKSDNLDEAVRLFDEMRDIGLESDTITYTALLSGYCRQGQVDKALNLVNDMIVKGGNIEPNARTMSVLDKHLKA